MQAWAIVLIVIVILIVFGLIIWGTIYLVRKEREPSGETGGGIENTFSFRPLTVPNNFVTITEKEIPSGSKQFPLIVNDITKDTTISCSDYHWKNQTYTNPFSNASQTTISNALIFQGSRNSSITTNEGIVGAILTTTPINGVPNNSFVFPPISIPSGAEVSWKYDSRTTTFCNSESPIENSSHCLFYDAGTETIVSRVLVPSTDSNYPLFQWTIESPIGSPSCSN